MPYIAPWDRIIRVHTAYKTLNEIIYGNKSKEVTSTGTSMSTPVDSWARALVTYPLHTSNMTGKDIHPVVYLGGPITGITYERANGWREKVSAALDSYGFECLSPMRRYKHTGICYTNNDPIPRLSKNTLDATGAMEGDLADIQAADYVLINFLDSIYPSIGSLVELGYAAALSKKIIAVLQPDDPHDHIFVTGLSLVVTSLDAAISAIVMADRQQQGDY